MYQKMGLVVEGGGTKAAYTAGVLKAFLQEKTISSWHFCWL